MNSTSHPSPLQSRYPTIDALFQAHHDQELTGPEDCMEFLNRSEIEAFVLREVKKCFERKKYYMPNVADEAKEKVEDAAIFETLIAMRDPKKIENYLAQGKFTDDASGQTTPTRRACVGYFIRLGQRVIKNRLNDHWRQSYRLRKNPIGMDDEANAVPDGSLVEPRKAELLEAATRIITSIACFCMDFLEDSVEKRSERYKAEIEALLDWKFGRSETADKAAQCHGANPKKVYEIWENINRRRDGKCRVHTWALKNRPELKDKINNQFECWYLIKDKLGKDWSSLLPRNPKQKSGGGT